MVKRWGRKAVRQTKKEKKQDPLKNLIGNRRKSINWAPVIDRLARCFLQRCQMLHNCDFSPPSLALSVSLVSVTLLFTYHHSVHLTQITLLSPPQCLHSLHFSLTLLSIRPLQSLSSLVSGGRLSHLGVLTDTPLILLLCNLHGRGRDAFFTHTHEQSSTPPLLSALQAYLFSVISRCTEEQRQEMASYISLRFCP